MWPDFHKNCMKTGLRKGRASKCVYVDQPLHLLLICGVFSQTLNSQFMLLSSYYIYGDLYSIHK